MEAITAPSWPAYDPGGGSFLRCALPALEYSSVVFVLMKTKLFGSLKIGFIPDCGMFMLFGFGGWM